MLNIKLILINESYFIHMINMVRFKLWEELHIAKNMTLDSKVNFVYISYISYLQNDFIKSYKPCLSC